MALVIFELGGVSICLCYTFQLTVFLPCLALNARRVATKYLGLFRISKPNRGMVLVEDVGT